jgi:TonB family protein
MNRIHTLPLSGLLLSAGALLALAAPPSFSPATLISGSPPPIPIEAVGGGEVFLELGVTESGQVDRVTPLRVTPPFVEPLTAAVQAWLFKPALDVPSTTPPSGSNPPARRPVRSSVLVAGVFRPPALFGPTLGTAPANVAQPSDAIPGPLTTATPSYPPLAQGDGVVIVEVTVDATGAPTNATVVTSSPAFDSAALDAARRWAFRPAQSHGTPVTGVVYLVFGFRQPVT